MLTKDSGSRKDSEEIPVTEEHDISIACQAGRRWTQELCFSAADQTSVITVILELARNIFCYASSGKIILSLVNDDGRKGLKISAVDSGPGIQNLDNILYGNYRSRTGMGLGLKGTRNLLDHFQIETSQEKGTIITGIKYAG